MSLKQTEAMNIINVRHYNIIQGNNGYSRTVGMLHYSTAGWLEHLTKSIFVLIEIQMRQGRGIVIHYLMWVEHIPTSHTYIEKCSSLYPPPYYPPHSSSCFKRQDGRHPPLSLSNLISARTFHFIFQFHTRLIIYSSLVYTSTIIDIGIYLYMEMVSAYIFI